MPIITYKKDVDRIVEMVETDSLNTNEEKEYFLKIFKNMDGRRNQANKFIMETGRDTQKKRLAKFLNKNLTREMCLDAIEKNPTIVSFIELCAIKSINPEKVPSDIKLFANQLIAMNITRMKTKIKNQLLQQGTKNSLEMLYKLLGNESELSRLQGRIDQDPTDDKPVIQITTKDDDMQNKLDQL